MDTLRPGHAHRSSSYRLLTNYLDTQKTILNTLLTLLSHSHSSTSSLLAYSTSSPGIQPPIRRSVRHAAFEGPLSPVLLNNVETGSTVGSDILGQLEADAQGWAAYVGSLERFRKDLKQIHKMEEEITRVKRDREILVSRLIKSTKSRPTKSDLTAIASQYRPETAMSSRASLSSNLSGGSNVSKEGKRANKLAEAQSELLGCEEHLAGLEAQIEEERNKVMLRGLEERFLAMEAVGRMWVNQAKKGMDDLGQIGAIPTADLYEIDSNTPSLSPSQSASQSGHDGISPRRGGLPFPRMPGPAGSINSSIAEEEEGSSGDEGAGNRQLTVHDNAMRGATPTQRRGGHNRPMSMDFGPPPLDSDEESPINHRSGGRRAASDVGVRSYKPPGRRGTLRRTNSHQQKPVAAVQDGHASDTSSAPGDGTDTGRKKKKGFFRSIVKFFQGPPRPLLAGHPGSTDSLPRRKENNTWNTRTDNNMKRSSSMFNTAGRRQNLVDDSSDDDGGNLVSVSNNIGGASTWGPASSKGGLGRTNSMTKSSSMPVASGLIPDPPNRANSGRATPSASMRSITPKPTPNKAERPVSRSGTIKSTMSTGSVKSNGTMKSTGTAKKRIRPNGSIARATGTRSSGETRNIMSLIEAEPTPTMPDVPRAPKSQTDPLAGSLPKAPGSSLIKADPIPKMQVNGVDKSDRPRPVSRTSSTRKGATTPKPQETPETSPKKHTRELPPSRTLSPPLKSALRPSSPAAPAAMPVLSPPIDVSKSLYSVSAPGPIEVAKEDKGPSSFPAAAPKTSPMMEQGDALANPAIAAVAGKPSHRESYQSSAGNSVYGTAEEDNIQPDGGAADETSESEYEEEGDPSRYQVYHNDRIERLGINVAPPKVEKVPDEELLHQPDYDSAVADDDSDDTAAPRAARDLLQPRRKSVRMDVPESPGPASALDIDQVSQTTETPATTNGVAGGQGQVPQGSPSGEFPHQQWSTRIGKMRDDTTDESSGDEEYKAARKGLKKNTGQWEAVPTAVEGKKKKAGSVKSKGSVKSR